MEGDQSPDVGIGDDGAGGEVLLGRNLCDSRVRELRALMGRAGIESSSSPLSSDDHGDDQGGFEVNSGQEEAFKELFERYSRGVTYFFVNRGCPLEDGRDLTQETFLEVFKSLPRFRPDGSSFEKWLFSIAGNVWKNRLRYVSTAKRSASEVPLSAVSEERLFACGDPGCIPEGEVLGRLLTEEKLNYLEEALAELPAQMRRCILLHLQGLKYREIAGALQLKMGTVKSHIHQAKDQLREKLARHFPDVRF